ncbi:VOC family protein [Nocardia sp. alder85J]|uniref:VOC family protein n=1 Tax=Nocardia sp. alder85J TaxID=2862949 RepID=UPI001CD707B3|nr:VOC family protein [Nocardia sp. alder85J]MCX4095647.1 VOC family protein [Nocardia sp. alder85J]
MAVTGVSHIAIGVRDMEKSLAFYRDALGLSLTVDRREQSGGEHPKDRRACYLRWSEGPGSSYIVLDSHLDRAPFGQPAELFQVGVHHFSFLTDDLPDMVRRIRDAGYEVWGDGSLRDGQANAEPEGDHEVLTVMSVDPDGNIVQFDQWL